jgi:hypothetical protein
VERLRAYDRNQDFLTSGNVLITPDDLKMPAWPHEAAIRSMMEDQEDSLPPLLSTLRTATLHFFVNVCLLGMRNPQLHYTLAHNSNLLFYSL